jgi:hypothetical protein
MPKRESTAENVKPSEARAQPCQRLPKGHFDSDGLSQGDMVGEGRTTHDAYQGPRPEAGEAK